MFWGFFCAYLAVGAYFNMLMQMLCYHQHRFAGPARMTLMAQVLSILCSIPEPTLDVVSGPKLEDGGTLACRR